MKHLLDNIFWHALSGPQARFAVGNESARRYAPGFSAIVAFADQLRPDLPALAAFCEPGERFYTEGWTNAAPAGWQIELESTMLKMIWEADMPPADEAPDALPLNAEARTAGIRARRADTSRSVRPAHDRARRILRCL